MIFDFLKHSKITLMCGSLNQAKLYYRLDIYALNFLINDLRV